MRAGSTAVLSTYSPASGPQPRRSSRAVGCWPEAGDPGSNAGMHGRRSLRFAFVAILALVLVGVAIAIAYLIASTSSSSSNTVQGSGVQVMESRTLPVFGSVDLAGSNNVFIRIGEEQSVQVYGDDNLIDRVTTDVDATTLVIGSKSGSYSTNSPMRVEVSVPSLRDLTLSGSGTVMVSGVDGRRFTVTISEVVSSERAEPRSSSTPRSAVRVKPSWVELKRVPCKRS